MIKWIGQDTSKTRKWIIKADSMLELYDALLDRDIINTYEYDPYQKAQIEKAGHDYFDLMNSFSFYEREEDIEKFNKIVDSLPKLTDAEIELMIYEQNSNAYYQTIQYI